MTDKNVDKRLFFTLYVEILRAGTEFLWAVEEFRGEGDLIDALESDETRRLRAESASSPLRLAVGRALRLLCTPETGEMNSYTQDQRMETDARLLSGYRRELVGDAEEMCAVVSRYTVRVLDRIRELFVSDGEASRERNGRGEDLALDLEDCMPPPSEIAL
jgi:hypothetical protein